MKTKINRLPALNLAVVAGLALAANLTMIQPAQAQNYWVNSRSMTSSRYWHTATLLPNGKVLVAGGAGVGSGNNPLASAELFDPATGTWTNTGTMNASREEHTATLLPNGKVLVAGGDYAYPVTTAELYDPATGIWTATGSMTTNRTGYTTTLLPSGKVLVAGGTIYSGGSYVATTELYDPASGSWTLTGSLSTGRSLHTATLLPDGHVLVAGGGGDAGGLNSVELYDPASGTWAVTNSLAAQRFYHRALLLPNGHVMIVGGLTTGAFFLATAESYDPASGTWTPASGLNIARYFFTATILPDGRLLAAGGEGNSGVLNSTEIYDPASGFWTNTGSMTIYRVGPTATLLANGKVLVTGANNSDSSTAELYDPATGTWTATGSMTTNRANHGSMSSLYTATLLANGKVLVAGGNDGSHALASAELYNQASSTWTLTGALNAVREGHTATLLPNGKVLVAGGDNDSGPLSSAEVYDPASGTWTLTGSLNTARDTHTATLLPNGKVLVAGGANNVSDVSDALVNAELYDPASGTWTNTGSLNTGRGWHTATLLPNGKVLVAGGRGHYARNPTLVEAFDPTSGTWTTNGSILYARYMHTATLLPDGKVLIAGGTSVGWITSAEVYDPVAGYTTANTSLNTARFGHAAAFLLNGKVLVTGGNTSNGLPTAELFDSGLGFNAAWQPQIATCTSPLTNGGKLTLTGTRFRGMSEGASGQTQDSPADYPVAQLRRLDNEQTLFLLPTNWQTNSFTSTPLTGLPNGYAMVTLFVNGIPSPAATLDLNPVATPIPFILTHPTDPTGKVFQCRFTNTPGLTFTVLGATNLSLPLSNWPVLGGVTEISPGLYQVTESTTNYGKQFYRVRSQ